MSATVSARAGLLSAFLLAAGVGHGASFAQNAPLPEFVNWSYDGAYQEDSGLRTSLCLNGWWRWAAADPKAPADEIPPESGLYRKVPGAGPNFFILGADGKPWPALAKMSAADRTAAVNGACWAEREFTVPAAWKDRDVRIILSSISFGDRRVYLDGKKTAGAWGQTPYCIDLPKPYKLDEPYRLTTKTIGGVINNIYLESYERTGARITDSYLTTSFRNRSATIRAQGDGPADCSATVVITEYRDPKKVVKTAGPFAVKPREGGGWALEQSFDWKDATPWWPSKPHLYNYCLELQNGKGAVVDRIFPIRFGFREIWIQGGDFMLNDRRITLTADIHTDLDGELGKYADEDTLRQLIRRWLAVGVNAITRYPAWYRNTDDSALFRIADEEGFFISVGLDYAQAEGNFSYQVRRLRHCPSVAAWHIRETENAWDYEMKHLGEDYDTELLFGKQNRPELALAHKLDPVRPAFSSNGGGKGQAVHSTLNYLHTDMDLQAHETWPAWWYLKKNKPLALYEMGEPPYVADWYMRRSRGDQAQGTRGALPFFMENAAITFGEEPYLTEPRASIEGWLKRYEANNGPAGTWEAKCYVKTADLYTRNVFRAWRTYGVNMSFFLQVRSFFSGYFKGDFYRMKVQQVDPRRPGSYADAPIDLGVTYGRLPYSEVGLVAKDALSPLLAYIGGPDGVFPQKDHTWYAGETVRKAVVMLNDRDDPATVSGAWELLDKAGKPVLQGAIAETKLQPGELAPARAQIEFKAPAVTERTDYTLKLHGKSDAAGVLEDEFALTVFPPAAAAKVGKGINIYLFDPIGDTRAMLQKAKVKFQELGDTLPDPENSLLIIGRNALKNEGTRKEFAALIYRKMGYAFNVNATNGMRVLVFEQGLENIWGMKTEQLRWRRAFNVAAGHPIFAGLAADDFLYLKGDSNLEETYPAGPPASRNRPAADRSTPWGNDNVVVTRSIVRPQIGAMRALLACGFDLQEAAILEAAAGKGRMLFCQVDVTNRYGADPVSTVLVNNMLSYMTTVAALDPAAGLPIDLVSDGAANYPVKVSKAKVFMLDRPDGPISWGITAADVYLEGHVELPVIEGEGGKVLLYAQPKGEKRILHVLNRRNVQTNWQKMKFMIMRSALQINQGGTAENFPQPALQGNVEEMYPVEWLNGFVSPYLIMQW